MKKSANIYYFPFHESEGGIIISSRSDGIQSGDISTDRYPNHFGGQTAWIC